MDKVSVGVMIIIMCVVILVEGIIVLDNVVCELEIVDMVMFFNKLGVKIFGAGMDSIIIEGVECFGGGKYVVVFDCIETGIFLVVVVVLCGKIVCCNIYVYLLEVVLVKFEEVGVEIECGEDWISLDMIGCEFKVVMVCIVLYLGFLIDM